MNFEQFKAQVIDEMRDRLPRTGHQPSGGKQAAGRVLYRNGGSP